MTSDVVIDFVHYIIVEIQIMKPFIVDLPVMTFKRHRQSRPLLDCLDFLSEIAKVSYIYFQTKKAEMIVKTPIDVRR